MKRTLVVIAIAVTGCGDNSNECGPGTIDVDGVCTGAGGMCGAGTKDDGTGVCVPDPADCQDGTVLIGGACVDPTKGLTIDVEEGAEPNGLGIAAGVENSTKPAGQITLKAAGQTTVVHGHITPFQDADGDGQLDPDFDTYVLQVDGPTLVDVSVDGVNGVDGAFYVIGAADGLAAWERYGVNPSGDTSQRRLFLPTAGIYAIAVADTRSMFIGSNPPFATGGGAASGGPDAEYFMSLTVAATPTPTSVTLDANGSSTIQGTVTSGDIKFFSVPMRLGFNDSFLQFAQTQANPGVVLYVNNTFFSEATQSPAPSAADIALGGIKTGDSTVVVVDQSFNTGVEPIQFQLAITTSDAKALSTTGTAVDEIETSSAPAGIAEFNAYFIDVAAANELDGLKLHWNHAVDGLIADSNLFVVAAFTFDVNDQVFVGNTFSDYAGAIRFPAPGRYYFVVYDPAGTAGTDTLTATSTITALTPTTVTEGTPLNNQAVNTFNLLPFSYNAGATDPWQQFDVTGTTTGVRTVNFLDPASAFGALSSFTSVDGVIGPDAIPVFSESYTGVSTAVGHIVADDPVTNYLVSVQTATGTGTVSLAFAPRAGTDFHDFGTVAAGTTVTNASSITAAAPRHFYQIKSAPGSIITVTLPSPAPRDLKFSVAAADESDATTVDAGGVGATETKVFTQGPSGLLPLVVESNVAGTSTFTISVKVDAGFYTSHDSATAFDDACNGGTMLPLDPTGGLSGQDEGLTAAVDAPAGFQFYGVAAPQFVVSSNGFLSFDTTLTSALLLSKAMPDGSGEVNVAAFWNDLDTIVVCSKTVGTKLIIQWVGTEFGASTTVQAQAILDGADNSIELVYGASTATGVNAVAGVQNQDGSAATETNEFHTIMPNTSKKLTHP